MFKKSQIEFKLDEEIIVLLTHLNTMKTKEGDEYAKVVDQLNKLYELRHKSRISKETLATIAANVAGIVIILSHERAHVIASKAFGLVKKIF